MKTCKTKWMQNIIILLLSMICLPLAAQNFKVTGIVSDEFGPLAGVSVKENNLNNGVITDIDGKYSLNINNGSASLEFSFIGFDKQIVSVKNRSVINITMTEQNKELNEVVVIGYGTSKKKDLTGSVATVDSKTIGSQIVQSAAQALQGKLAGVQITNAGSPGSTPQIRIRGLGTVTDGANPLYVVDGVIVDDINYLAPSDIENISVLKDASSAAIYGVRAAGGVIIVTTKQGQFDGKPSISFNSYLGYKKASHVVKMASGSEYITLYNEKMSILGESRQLNPSDFTSHNYFNDVLTDSWVNSQDFSVSGGSSTSRYNFGLRHLKDDGLIKGNNFERIGFRSKFDVDISKYIRTGFSVILQSAKSNPVDESVLLESYRALPIYAAQKEDGTWSDPNVDNVSGTMGNPTAKNYYDHQWKTQIDAILNGYLEVKFLKYFTAKTDLSLNPSMNNYIQFTPIYHVTEFQNSTKNTMLKSRYQNVNFYWDNTLAYSTCIKDAHNLKVMVGTSYQSTEYNYLSAKATGLKDLPKINHSYLFLSMPKIDEDYSASVNDNGDKNIAVSYMGRLTYDYKNKYLFNFTAREDGSTRFPSDNRWGFFPSVGLGWVASQEDFIERYQTVDFLKLRASWGIIGNGNIPSNIYVPTINKSAYYGVIFGPAQNTGSGLVMYPGTITDMYNPNLKWETVHEYDLGLDLIMFRQKFSATLDFYSKETRNAIFPLMNLGSSGLSASGVWGNNATISNTGIELTLGWYDRKNDFGYSISGNFTYNKNKLKSLNSEETNGIYGKYEDSPIITYSTLGNPIGSYYGYKVVGVFQNQAQIDVTPHMVGAKPGDLIYADVNGDEQIDEADRTFLGNPNPPVFFGLDLGLTYKNFDFNISMQGVAGNKIFNANRMFRYGTENFDKDFVDNRWHGEGTSNSYPSAAWSNPTTPSSFYVEDGSYLRIKSIQLGYSLPVATLSKVGIKQLRFYLNAENPITFTKYNGFSPEVTGGALMTGVDRNAYPLASVYSLGVNLSF